MNGLFQKILPGLVVAGLIAAVTTGTGLAVLASAHETTSNVVHQHVALDAHPKSATDHAVEQAKREALEKSMLKMDGKLDDILTELRKSR